MSSLFNKEDEDKLLPPEPCADQYVCVWGGGGWRQGVGSGLGLRCPSPWPLHMVCLRAGEGQPLLYLFLLAGKGPNLPIRETRLDLRRNLPALGTEVLEGTMGSLSPSIWEGSSLYNQGTVQRTFRCLEQKVVQISVSQILV